MTVQAGGKSVEARVQVKLPEKKESQSTDGHDDGKKVQTTQKAIRWTGDVPHRKWMNFYTKVITKFASSPGLQLRVSLEASDEGGDMLTKIEDIKSALRELGLSEEVNH